MRRFDRTTAQQVRRYLVRLPKREGIQNEQWALLVARTRPRPIPRTIPRRDPYWWHRKRTRRHLRPMAALGVVQAANNASTTGATTTATISPSAGNALVAYVKQNVDTTTNATMAVTTTGSTPTWSQTAGGYATSGSGSRAGMFFTTNLPDSLITGVKVTWGAISGRIGIVVYEVSGMVTASPEDGTSVNSSGTGTSTGLVSGSRTTANANDILFYGTSATAALTSVTADTTNGFAFQTNSIGVRMQMQFVIRSSTWPSGTTTTTWSSATTNREGIFAAFKAGSGSTNVTVALTGSSMTATAGNLSETGDANLTISGSSMTATAGNLTPAAGASVALTGSSMTATAGNLSVSGSANVPITGSSITATAGNLSVTGSANVTLVGSSFTATAGNLSVSTGTNVTVALTGNSITAAAGNLATSGDANVPISGSSLSAAAGNLSMTGDANVSLSGNLATFTAGNLSVTLTGTQFIIWIADDFG